MREPEPLRPVTASSCSSGTSWASPAAASRRATSSRSPAPVPGPMANPAAIAPTRQGVLGITRTSRARGMRAASRASDTPARMEMISPSLSWSPAVAAATSCGLTARKQASAARLAAAASAVTVTPSNSRLNSAQRSSSLSYTAIRPARPPLCRQRASANPMLPAPMNPMLSTVKRP